MDVERDSTVHRAADGVLPDQPEAKRIRTEQDVEEFAAAALNSALEAADLPPSDVAMTGEGAVEQPPGLGSGAPPATAGIHQ